MKPLVMTARGLIFSFMTMKNFSSAAVSPSKGVAWFRRFSLNTSSLRARAEHASRIRTVRLLASLALIGLAVYFIVNRLLRDFPALKAEIAEYPASSMLACTVIFLAVLMIEGLVW